MHGCVLQIGEITCPKYARLTILYRVSAKVTGTFVPTYFCSWNESYTGGTFVPWNVCSREWKWCGTFAPGKGKWHGTFVALAQKLLRPLYCIHGEQGSHDVILCTRPVEACRPTHLIMMPPRRHHSVGVFQNKLGRLVESKMQAMQVIVIVRWEERDHLTTYISTTHQT